jgi:hypothetical protein
MKCIMIENFLRIITIITISQVRLKKGEICFMGHAYAASQDMFPWSDGSNRRLRPYVSLDVNRRADVIHFLHLDCQNSWRSYFWSSDYDSDHKMGFFSVEVCLGEE